MYIASRRSESTANELQHVFIVAFFRCLQMSVFLGGVIIMIFYPGLCTRCLMILSCNWTDLGSSKIHVLSVKE